MRIHLFAAEKASWAISFYRSLGYEETGRIPRPWGVDVEMQKNLEIVDSHAQRGEPAQNRET